jgi:hypothetical protein
VADLSDEDMLAELGAVIEDKPERRHTAREERVIAGFEDIARFCETHGRAPLHGEGRDIFERLYAVRLDRLRALPEYHALLAPLDTHGLLKGDFAEPPSAARGDLAEAGDEDLLAELGVSAPDDESIASLRHVRSQEERRAAEDIANRERCADFKTFEPLFEQVRRDLQAGVRQTRRFGENASIKLGEFFILGGQLAFVAAVPEELTTEHGHAQGRLRVIYDNGTESDPLLRSFQRALYKDETGRRITDPSAGPLFADHAEDDDVRSGTIYVLQSLSEHPQIAGNREWLHKIGVTGGDVEARIADAMNQATFLLGAVKRVRTYQLYNINRTKLEHLLHEIFAPARLDVEIADRFGKPVKPREWFLAPLSAIDEAVERIRDGSIVGRVYDPATASFTTA